MLSYRDVTVEECENICKNSSCFSAESLRNCTSTTLTRIARAASVDVTEWRDGRRRRMMVSRRAEKLSEAWYEALKQKRLWRLQAFLKVALSEYNVSVRSVSYNLRRALTELFAAGSNRPEPTPQQAVNVYTLTDEQYQAINKRVAEEVKKAATAVIDAAKSEADAVLSESRERVRAFLDSVSVPRKVIVERARPKKTIDLGLQHECFEELLEWIEEGSKVYMHGPAGSGKSTAAKSASTALGVDFYPVGLGLHTSEPKLLGYMLPGSSGNYIPSAFRRGFEHGGVVCLDEIDRCNPKILPVLNGAIDNGICEFPDKIVTRHPDCIIVATGNTKMNGADRRYGSAQVQDGAVKDRFVFLPWNYDESFERAIAKSYWPACDSWVDYVQQVRRVVDDHNMEYIVGPRKSIFAAQSWERKVKKYGPEEAWSRCESRILYAGWEDDDIRKVKAIVPAEVQAGWTKNGGE